MIIPGSKGILPHQEIIPNTYTYIKENVMKKNRKLILCGLTLTTCLCLGGTNPVTAKESTAGQNLPLTIEKPLQNTEKSTKSIKDNVTTSKIKLSDSWTYAGNSKIHSGYAILYTNHSKKANGITVCVNAGHGTEGGSGVQTLSHPDGTPKVTGGTTAAGAIYSTAISTGTTFLDGTPERNVTLRMAKILRTKLLKKGYNVLMIRETNDVQLDNIARTVIANNNADCHIALHWDSTASDKGAFFMSVPNISSYRAMEPVASHWKEHNLLGTCLISGLKKSGQKIFGSGSMEMDLTQTSYSTIPSVDIELGDRASDYSDGHLKELADGLVKGINGFFKK